MKYSSINDEKFNCYSFIQFSFVQIQQKKAHLNRSTKTVA